MASSAPPSEFFPGIDFNISFYTEGDSSVTLNYVNSNFLKCVGYAYSRAISTSFNGVIYALDGINTTNITATGTITANLFSGSGASLTSLDASNITSGTINNDRITLTDDKIPDLSTSKITTGILSAERGGTGVNGFGMYRILFGSGGNGSIATLPDLTFDGSTLTCYGEFNTFKGLQWGSQFSRLNRVLTANQYSTGSVIGDIVLISDAKLHLVGGSTGSTAPGLTINALNNIGIGTTTPAADEKLRVVGNIKTTGTVTIDTNLVVGGSTGIVGTSQFTGNVGIGTTPHATYKLNVDGTINATNIFLNGIAFGGTQWLLNTTDVTKMYYNNGNLGIGTTDPTNKLHIRDDTTNTTALTIQNNNTTITLPDAIVVSGATGEAISGTTDRCIQFTYYSNSTYYSSKDYTFTTTEPLICDILIVGGGGGGAHNHGGGGGGGAVVFINSVVLNIGSYTIKVGAGGAKGTRSTTNFGGRKGNDTIIILNGTDILKAEGGGGGSQGSATGSIGNGGSGGGGDGYRDGLSVYNNGVVGTGSIKDYNGTTGVLYGNNGGSYYLATSGTYLNLAGAGGGGGGAGQIGGNATKVNVAGNGGNGISSATINGNTYNFVSMFGTTYGTNDDNNSTTRYFGGGGGGGLWGDPQGAAPAGDIGGTAISGSGGKGGGGMGALQPVASGFPGSANTGGGGGGGSYGSTDSRVDGGNGGSGIVIIRYRRPPTKTSCIELINGTTTDTNTDYTLGNYNNIFKVFAKVENLSNEVLTIDKTTLKLDVPYGITTNSTIVGSLRSNGILYADYGIIGTGNIQTTGNIYTQNGQITGGNMTINQNMTVSGTINSVSSSDWLRKSECVLYVAATTRVRTGVVVGGLGSYTWTSVFHIPVNLVRSEYNRPQIQWRLRMAFSSGNSDSIYSYGFFKVIMHQDRNYLFHQFIEEPTTYDYNLSTNFDGSGNSRVIITIANSNSPTHINVNIA